MRGVFSCFYAVMGLLFLSLLVNYFPSNNAPAAIGLALSHPLSCVHVNQNAHVGQIVNFEAIGGGSAAYYWFEKQNDELLGTGKHLQKTYPAAGAYQVSLRNGGEITTCTAFVELNTEGPSLASDSHPFLPSPSPTAKVKFGCLPKTQTITVASGSYATFTSVGAAAHKTISWSAPKGKPSSGKNSSFATHYPKIGKYSVTLKQGKLSSICKVQVVKVKK